MSIANGIRYFGWLWQIEPVSKPPIAIILILTILTILTTTNVAHSNFRGKFLWHFLAVLHPASQVQCSLCTIFAMAQISVVHKSAKPCRLPTSVQHSSEMPKNGE
jgi:hypothetical protein